MSRPQVFVLGSRNDEKENIGNAVMDHMEERGWRAVGTDCWNPDVERYTVPDVMSEWGADADALVISLGKTVSKPFFLCEEEDISEVINACLTLPLLCARAYALERLARQKEEQSRIVLVGSYAHRHPLSNSTAYCSAKAGIDMAAKCLGWELTDAGIYTVAVHPYHVEDSEHMWEEVQQAVMEGKGIDRAAADEYARKDLKMSAPLSRHDIAQVIGNWLDSDAAAWQSGSSIELFGGSR